MRRACHCRVTSSRTEAWESQKLNASDRLLFCDVQQIIEVSFLTFTLMVCVVRAWQRICYGNPSTQKGKGEMISIALWSCDISPPTYLTCKIEIQNHCSLLASNFSRNYELNPTLHPTLKPISFLPDLTWQKGVKDLECFRCFKTHGPPIICARIQALSKQFYSASAASWNLTEVCILTYGLDGFDELDFIIILFYWGRQVRWGFMHAPCLLGAGWVLWWSWDSELGSSFKFWVLKGWSNTSVLES